MIICGPRLHNYTRRVRYCPWCKTRRRMVMCDQEWYDIRFTCCTCGESWEGGVVLPRPFERGWRAKAAARAKEIWGAIGVDR